MTNDEAIAVLKPFMACMSTDIHLIVQRIFVMDKPKEEKP